MLFQKGSRRAPPKPHKMNGRFYTIRPFHNLYVEKHTRSETNVATCADRKLHEGSLWHSDEAVGQVFCGDYNNVNRFTLPDISQTFISVSAVWGAMTAPYNHDLYLRDSCFIGLGHTSERLGRLSRCHD